MTTKWGLADFAIVFVGVLTVYARRTIRILREVSRDFWEAFSSGR